MPLSKQDRDRALVIQREATKLVEDIDKGDLLMAEGGAVLLAQDIALLRDSIIAHNTQIEAQEGAPS